MKELILIYDERIRPGDEIREITGEKSFARIIYKRRELKSLFDSGARKAAEKARISPEIRHWTEGEPPVHADRDKKAAIVLVFSDCVMRDSAELSVVLKKAGYIQENYVVFAKDSVAAILYKDVSAFLSDCSRSEDSREIKERGKDYEVIESGAFSDISGREAFLSFLTGGFEARFFNSLSGDEYTVVKSSRNKEKIAGEYRFYGFLPESMKSWFVLPYDFREEGDTASYRMQRYHMTDLAIRYVHGAISPEEFKRVLDLIFVFLKSRTEKEVTWNEFYEKRKELYITKVEKRIEELKGHADFPKLEAAISNGTSYSGIDGIIKEYEDLYDSMAGKTGEKLVKTVSHGDLCFSNILYSKEAGLLRLIDPKGAAEEEDLFSDPLYDVAKLSHSISGRYDFMNSGLYEIEVMEDLKLKLKIDGDVSEYRAMFEEKLKESGTDLRTVRLFECSLFLSMLPLHMDRPQKVMAFILNAINILKELKR